ncbi:Uu.00g044930.m01.CDS01 [Anthostomella pinea]|uniref:Uu.00g044930.m01.CDS01 n=1 Tax=Anthostomella pinea TaxID=933095 RepID=A0AAI8VC04_9PEZI|nr:Uu.00g044930.m01.CDS01 [Anthostomella pinea]
MPDYNLEVRCPLCAEQFFVKARRAGRFTEWPGWAVMRVVIWKEGSHELATLGWVKWLVPNNITGVLHIHVSHSEQDASNKKTPAARVMRLGRDTNTGEFAFICDGACWEIAATRFGTADSPEDPTLATGLARMLASINWNIQTNTEPMRVLSARVPFDGFWPSLKEPKRLGQEVVLTKQGITSLSKFLTGLKLLEGKPKTSTTSRRFSQRRPAVRRRRCVCNDIFARLPVELLMHIVCFVHTQDLPRLRLASKDIAGVSSLNQLSRSFWQTRFYEEFGYAVPRDVDGQEDWRALHFSMPRLWRPSIASSIFKRASVWHGLDHVGLLVNRTLQGLPVEEADLRSLRAETQTKCGLTRRILKLVKPVDTQLRPLLPGQTTPRIVELRRSPCIGRDYQLRGIGVTMSKLGNRSDELGYTCAATETVLEVSQSEDLAGFKLLHSEDRVTGIRLLVSNKKTWKTRQTDWVRDPAQSVEKPVLVRRQFPWTPFSLIGSFDYCGLVGVSVFGEGLVCSR